MEHKDRKRWLLFGVSLAGILLVCFFIGGWITEGGMDPGKNIPVSRVFFPTRWPSYLNRVTGTACGAGLGLWVFLCSRFLMAFTVTDGDSLHGTARWADLDLLNRRHEDRENPGQNRIVSKNLRISLEAQGKALINNNALYIGSPGTGKTKYEITPNVLLLAASYVLLDVKGELLRDYGHYFLKHGYRLKVLNLKEMGRSDRYNPFPYIRDQDDIPRLIETIFKSVEPPDAVKNDPFWEDGCALYLQSLFYFVWMVPDREKQNILELAGADEKESPSDREEFLTKTINQVTLLARYQTMNVKYYPHGIPVDSGKHYSMLNKIMDILSEKDPMGMSHPAVADYERLMGGAQETIRSIVLILNAKLKFFNSPAVQRIFSDDDMELETLGAGADYDEETKTVMFLVVEENHTSYNFVINMLYQQIFDTLIRLADFRYQGRLPIRVEFWLDEFANGARPERFENLITTLRSRNIAAMLFLQSIAQLQTLYKGDAWKIIFDSCPLFIFLGCGRASYHTAEEISKMLGDSTKMKRSDSLSDGGKGNQESYDRAGKPLMRPDEILRMPNKYCIVLIEGEQPAKDVKHLPFGDASFLEAMSYGPYEHGIRTEQLPNGIIRTLGGKAKIRYVRGKGMTHYKKEGLPVFELDGWDGLLEIEFPDELDDFDLWESDSLAGKKSGKVFREMVEEQKRLQAEKLLRQLDEALGSKPEKPEAPIFLELSLEDPSLQPIGQMERWLHEAEPFFSKEEEDEALAAFADGLPMGRIKEMMELADLDRMKRYHNILTADLKRKRGGDS